MSLEQGNLGQVHLIIPCDTRNLGDTLLYNFIPRLGWDFLYHVPVKPWIKLKWSFRRE